MVTSREAEPYQATGRNPLSPGVGYATWTDPPGCRNIRDMIVLAIVCGVFAGFAARRFLSARDAWDFWRLRRATLPGLRGVFYRDARRSVGWALGAVVLFFVVVHLV
jgi:hypothetical protein